MVFHEAREHCAPNQVEALKDGRIRKPVVAWVSGTCAKLFKSEVQFGHAGAKSGGQAESAQARAAYAFVALGQTLLLELLWLQAVLRRDKSAVGVCCPAG